MIKYHRMTVGNIPLQISSECLEKLIVSLLDEYGEDDLIIATIYFAKNDESEKYHLIERKIFVGQNEHENNRIEFETQIRNLPFRSILELQFWKNKERAELTGRIVLPVFNPNAVLLSGKYSIEMETDWAVCLTCSDAILDRSPRKRQDMKISNSDLAYHLGAEPGESSPSRVRLSINDSFLSQGEGTIVLYSDSYKSISSHHRVYNSLETVAKSTFNKSGDEDVLTNWMVINGPVKTGKPGTTAGSGYVSLQELRSCIAPSPVQVVDYELFREHPAAVKASKLHKLVVPHHQTSLQPNPDEISLLNDIILQPMRDLSSVERELVLKFMWSLKDKKLALLKVLIVVADAVTDESECLDLVSKVLRTWTPVDLDAALALLGDEIGSLSPQISGNVRSYAINRLSAVASKQEVQLYMFQLVQSLRFDQMGGLANFLIDIAVKDEEIGSLLFWHLQCESDDVVVSAVSLFGSKKASSNQSVIFQQVSQQLWQELSKTEQGKRIREGIDLQCQFRDRLLDISNQILSPPKGMETLSKNEMLKEGIRGNASTGTSIIGKLNLTNKLNFPQIGGDFVQIPIPLDPNLCLIRVDESKSFCIKSAKSPFVISCELFDKRTRETLVKRYMFKTGDDLRQDQLIIQFISLMDGLFKSYGLDLKLTPYKVLAASTGDGFVEFVSDSSTLSSILSSHNNDLLAYFRSLRPRSDNQLGVDPSLLDTFARSCAGYCAITYILGIGDRHMDNLLITTDGRLFHVDFGFILGRDPKPFPPPMKLCREMVEAMGGANSIYYRSFVSKCTQAFLIMRRHATLLVSLLYLAADANLKDMREQDPTMAILKVQKRLMPEVSDEVAEQQMINLINESTNALFPVVMEKLHKWAIYWRN